MIRMKTPDRFNDKLHRIRIFQKKYFIYFKSLVRKEYRVNRKNSNIFEKVFRMRDNTDYQTLRGYSW